MKKAIYFLALYGFIFFTITACGNGSNKTSDNIKSENSTNESQNTASNNNCLEPFYSKPENILTKEMVAKHVDFEGAEVESKTLAESLNKTELSKGFLDIADIQFKWKIERQRSKVQFGSIKKIRLYKSNTPVDRFYAKYHTPSPEEQAEKKR